MALTIKNPYPTDKPHCLPENPNPPASEGAFSVTEDFTGFIPGRRYALVISGYNGHTTEPQVQGGDGEWGPALAEGTATSFWNDEIVMPTDTLRIDVTNGTGDLYFTATLIND